MKNQHLHNIGNLFVFFNESIKTLMFLGLKPLKYFNSIIVHIVQNYCFLKIVGIINTININSIYIVTPNSVHFIDKHLNIFY